MASRTKIRAGSPHASPLTPDGRSALVIFAKAPIPGQVKTRLCPPLTSDEAATLHGTFVLETLERSRDAVAAGRLPVDRFVACAPSPEHAFFKAIEGRHQVGLIPQLGDDLGARMRGALQQVLERGYGQAILVGTDIPLLPGSVYGEAIRLLTSADLVLGPALDGGYYLLGAKRVIPELFANVPWSTDRTLSETVKIAESLGLRTDMLPPFRDVDRLEDLLATIEETGAAGARTSRASRPPEGKGGHRSAPSSTTRLLSKRTMGVLQTLAQRLRSRETPPAKEDAAP